MKILQFIPSLICAGAEVMCRNLTLELLKLGHDVEIVSEYDCCSDLTKELSKVVPIHFLGKKKGFDPKIIPKARKIIKQFSPDIIHTHLDAIKYAYLASMFLNVPIVHTVHNVAQCESGGIAMKLNRYLFKRKKAIPIALSSEIQETIVEYYGLPKEKIPIAINGVSVDQIAKKQSYALPNGKCKIVHVAAFRPQKNHLFLLQIVEDLSLIRQDFEVYFYGEGPLLDECKQYAFSHNLDPLVHFEGVDSQIKDKLFLYDIFVLPSKYEGLPMSILEAMSAGLPVIVSPVGGIPNVIRNGSNGILCDLKKEEYVDFLLRLMNDEKLRRDLGEKAVMTAHQYYSAETMARKYEEIYFSVNRLLNKKV